MLINSDITTINHNTLMSDTYGNIYRMFTSQLFTINQFEFSFSNCWNKGVNWLHSVEYWKIYLGQGGGGSGERCNDKRDGKEWDRGMIQQKIVWLSLGKIGRETLMIQREGDDAR